MVKIRVLIVDDSVVVRRLVAEALSADPACEVVGTAANGKIALAKIPQVNPDVVTMDIEMPEMDGLTTLAEIRKRYPKLPVIMLSALTERAAAATLQALSLGANDYVAKPSAASIGASIEQLRDQLLSKVQFFGAHSSALPPEPPRERASVVEAWARSRSAPIVEIVALGCSTGGPNALATILESFPPRLDVPVVIVQHMPPVFTRLLAERLHAQTQLDVKEAQGGEILSAGDIWIAPGDHHMVVRREGGVRRLAIVQTPPENSCRPAVDVLFRSVVEHYGARTLAVVLTGMGQDGLHGCGHVREAGGQIVVQDEASSVVWGMPGFVARAGLADAVVPLKDVAAEITRRVGGGRPSITDVADAPKRPPCR